MLNRATNSLSIRFFSDIIYGIGLDTNGRLVITGASSSSGYTTKLMLQSISAHPDFQTAATWTMNALPSGTEDIVADSGQTIGTVTTKSVSVSAYSNNTVTYVPGSSYTKVKYKNKPYIKILFN